MLSHLRFDNAAAVPSATPITSAEAKAIAPSLAVTGKLCEIVVPTSRPGRTILSLNHHESNHSCIEYIAQILAYLNCTF